jgi:hypothetical protein
MPLWASVLISIIVIVGGALNYVSFGLFEHKNSKEKKK